MTFGYLLYIYKNRLESPYGLVNMFTHTPTEDRGVAKVLVSAKDMGYNAEWSLIFSGCSSNARVDSDRLAWSLLYCEWDHVPYSALC